MFINLKQYLDLFFYKINSLFSRRNAFSALVINSKLDKTSAIRQKCRFYNSSLGKYSYIARETLVQNTTIGAFCSISERCNIGMPSHPLNFFSTSPAFLKGKNYLFVNFAQFEYEDCPRTIIGNDVWIGANVLIKSGINIGNGAVIGAGAVVTKDVPAYAIVAGVPAKLIRYRFDEFTINNLIKINWWNQNDNWLKKNGNYFISPELLLKMIKENMK